MSEYREIAGYNPDCPACQKRAKEAEAAVEAQDKAANALAATFVIAAVVVISVAVAAFILCATGG